MSRGFSLIEVALAVGITGFALMAIVGLLPVGLSSNRAAKEQTAAGNIASLIASDLQSATVRAATTTNTFSPRYRIELPGTGGTAVTTFFLTGSGDWSGDGQQPTTSPAPDSRFRVSVETRTFSDLAVTGFIRLSWPASASVVQAAGSLELPVVIRRKL